MDPISPEKIAAACCGQWQRMPLGPLCSVCVDSRRAGSGSLFFALKGEKADGHDFLPAIASAGACAVVRADVPLSQLPTDGCFLRVENVLAALGRFAAAYRSSMPARLVGVTGSVGKTSTKELVADVLDQTGLAKSLSGRA